MYIFEDFVKKLNFSIVHCHLIKSCYDYSYFIYIIHKEFLFFKKMYSATTYKPKPKFAN